MNTASPSLAIGAAPRDHLARQVWERVFAYRLMPPRAHLHRLIFERDALGTTLWNLVMQPALIADVPALFAGPATDPAMRRVAMDLRRVGASGYALGSALYYLHGSRPAAAQTVGVTAMWLAQTAAVIDYLLDEEALDPALLGAHLTMDAFTAALPGPGRGPTVTVRFDARPHPPELRFVLVALEQAFAGLRACLADAPSDEYHHRLHGELLVSLRAMVDAELGSPRIGLGDCTELDAIEQSLDRVNTLSCRLFALAGLALEPAPAPAVGAGVERAARLAGDIGWTLDALEDICPDLEHRVWNRAWLRFCRDHTRQDLAAWHALLARPTEAIGALVGSGVIDRLLAGVETGLDELGGLAAFPVESRRQLADVCRLFVWSFLAPPARATS